MNTKGGRRDAHQTWVQTPLAQAIAGRWFIAVGKGALVRWFWRRRCGPSVSFPRPVCRACLAMLADAGGLGFTFSA